MKNNEIQKNSIEFRLKEVEIENELLLRELHQAQEALEHYYAEGPQDYGKQLVEGASWLDSEFPAVVAENQRLQALIDVLQKIRQLESTNALNVRLGDILIQGVDAPGSLLSVPGKLAKIWRQTSRRSPPEALGGKEFEHVKRAYDDGGFASVERLMSGLSISPVMQANAYTVLARKLAPGDRAGAAEAARRAHNLDPKPYRLKWLAFRLHENGEVIEAEAMLDILPEETRFSDSEERQANQLRHDAKLARERAAMSKTAFAERRAVMDAQWKKLLQERDHLDKVVNERGREIELLKQAHAKLEQEKTALAERHDFLGKQLAESSRELDALRKAKMQWEADRSSMASGRERLERLLQDRDDVSARKDDENRLLLTNLHQLQEELEQLLEAQAYLEQANLRFQQEVRRLEVECAEQSRISVARDREMEVLMQAKVRLEHDAHALAVEREVQARVAEARAREIEELKQVKARLEQERHALAVERDVQLLAAKTYDREIEALKLAKATLEQEKQALAADGAAKAGRIETRERELEALKRTKAQLEQEKTALISRNRIAARQGSKGDTDIDDLIFDLELFFGGKAIVYVDVGSYVGDVFLKLKRTAKRFRIHEAHLYEPNPVSYAQLVDKTSGESGTTIHTYNFAIGESTDTSRFIKAKSMTKVLSSDLADMATSDDVFTAHRTTLDSQSSIFTDGKINLLKIDVEGNELDVLAGARELLAAQRVDVLYIEVGFNLSGTQQTYFAEIDRFMQSLNYRVLRVYEQKEEWMNDSPLLRRANIAYMSEKFANAHPLKLMQEVQDLKDKLRELTGSEGGK
ncbi:FkbM family methyltransferase [Burkholderia multivorans]|nr:FkbM family methyltransferase [Burkholderia multivorans]